MIQEELREKIRQAEESVSDIKDENLKKTAFETVLSTLLRNVSTSVGTDDQIKKITKNKRKSFQKKDKQRLMEEKKSTIKLSVDQLKTLREFYDKHAPNGTEETVFVLAYFLNEILSIKKFHSGDIHLVYQDLVPQKPNTKPPAMSLDQIKRAVGWLVVPSRKKRWFQSLGDGMFEISPQGMLKVSYSQDKTL